MSAPHAQVERADFDRYMVPNYAPPPSSRCEARDRASGTRAAATIDFAGGIAVTSLGHAHPALVKALTEQAQRIWHVSNVFTNEPALRLARKLVDATFAERVFLANSGAEANEAAFNWLAATPTMSTARRVRDHRRQQQLPRAHPVHRQRRRPAKYSDGFGPKFEVSPTFLQRPGSAEGGDLRQDLRRGAGTDPGRGRRAAGAAGLPGRARKLCDEHNALLVFDEVQSGMGRVGELFAYMHRRGPGHPLQRQEPGRRLPIGAMLTTGEIAKHLSVGTRHHLRRQPAGVGGGRGGAGRDQYPEVLDGVKAKHERFKSACRRSARSTASSARFAAWVC